MILWTWSVVALVIVSVESWLSAFDSTVMLILTCVPVCQGEDSQIMLTIWVHVAIVIVIAS